MRNKSLLLSLVFIVSVTLALNLNSANAEKSAPGSENSATASETTADRVSSAGTFSKVEAKTTATGDQDTDIRFGTSPNTATLPLRDMVQVPLKDPSVYNRGSDQKRGLDVESGGVSVTGVSCKECIDRASSAAQRVRVDRRGFRIIDNATGNSILGPSDISTIWAGLGGACETGGANDPVARYDKDADRWIISQFARVADGMAATEECFAVSNTGDPMGSYSRYAFHLGGNFVGVPK